MASRIFSIARSLLHPPSVAVEPFSLEIHQRNRSAIVRSRKRASGGMADALASGASPRKGVGVQVPSRARKVRVISGIFAHPAPTRRSYGTVLSDFCFDWYRCCSFGLWEE
jgi:hypothetical protein